MKLFVFALIFFILLQGDISANIARERFSQRVQQLVDENKLVPGDQTYVMQAFDEALEYKEAGIKGGKTAFFSARIDQLRSHGFIVGDAAYYVKSFWMQTVGIFERGSPVVMEKGQKEKESRGFEDPFWQKAMQEDLETQTKAAFAFGYVLDGKYVHPQGGAIEQRTVVDEPFDEVFDAEAVLGEAEVITEDPLSLLCRTQDAILITEADEAFLLRSNLDEVYAPPEFGAQFVRNLCVIRDENGEFQEPKTVSVAFLTPYGYGGDQRNFELGVGAKFRAALRVAKEEKISLVIIGAQKPACTLAKILQQVLGEKEFQGVFQKVIIAVDPKDEEKLFDAFDGYFGK